VDWISELLADIDAKRVQPRSHIVSRRLADLEVLDDPLAAEIVQAFDAGVPVPNVLLLELLWSRIGEVENPKQGAFRTLVSLLKPDEPIDSYHADFLILWAQHEGVPDQAINAAFRAAK